MAQGRSYRLVCAGLALTFTVGCGSEKAQTAATGGIGGAAAGAGASFAGAGGGGASSRGGNAGAAGVGAAGNPNGGAANSAGDGGANSAGTSSGPSGEFCPSQWCWSNPLPQGNGVNSIWAFPGSDVWIGGDAATLGRFHSGQWQFYPLNGASANSTVNSIWGSGPKDVWVSTGYALFHFDGSAVSQVPPPASAQPGTDEFYYQISGSGADDVWVAGFAGLYHFIGNGWSAQPFLVGHRVQLVAAASSSEAWAATADDNHLERWNGSTWSDVAWSQPAPLFEGLWAAAVGSVWLIDNGTIWHGDGTGFQQVPNIQKGVGTYYYQQLFGVGAQDLWVISDGATVQHRQGQTITTVPFDPTLPSSPFVGQGLSNGELWLGGRWGRLWRYDTDHFTLVTPPLTSITTTGDLKSAWANSAGAVLAVGNAYVRKVDQGWEPVPLNSGSTSANAVWGRSESDAWAVGGFATVEHYDGKAWSAVDPGVPTASASRFALYAVNGTDTGEVWAVGQSGQYLHFDPSTGTTWTFGVSDTVSDLHGLWVHTADDVWACGQNGTIERWARGVGWQKATSTPAAALTAIWGRSDTDVWAVASTSAIFHFDGSSWKTVPGPASDTAIVLNGLAGQADGTLWAVGKQGTILHYTGSAWEREASGLSTDLLSVAVGAGGAVWAVGVNQFILERMP